MEDRLRTAISSDETIEGLKIRRQALEDLKKSLPLNCINFTLVASIVGDELSRSYATVDEQAGKQAESKTIENLGLEILERAVEGEIDYEVRRNIIRVAIRSIRESEFESVRLRAAKVLHETTRNDPELVADEWTPEFSHLILLETPTLARIQRTIGRVIASEVDVNWIDNAYLMTLQCLDHDEKRIRHAAASALCKIIETNPEIGDAESVTQIIDCLSSMDSTFRNLILDALEILGKTRSEYFVRQILIPTLVTGFEEASPRGQAGRIAVIGRITHTLSDDIIESTVIPRFLDGFRHDDTDVRQAAAEWIEPVVRVPSDRVVSDEIVPQLVSILCEENPDEEVYVPQEYQIGEGLRKIIETRPHAAITDSLVSDLAEALTDDDTHVQEGAAEALIGIAKKEAERLDDPTLLRPLHTAVEDTVSGSARRRFIRVFNQLAISSPSLVAKKQIFSILTKQIKTINMKLRWKVCETIGEVVKNNPKPVVEDVLTPEILNILEDEELNQNQGLEIFGDLTTYIPDELLEEFLFPALVEKLATADPEYQGHIAQAAGSVAERISISDQKILSELLSLLTGADAETRSAVALLFAVNDLHDEKAADELVSALLTAVNDDDSEVRRLAVAALSRNVDLVSGNRYEITNTLRDALNDSDPDVRTEALSALRDFAQSNNLQSFDPQIIESVVETLLHDDEPDVREQSAWALREVVSTISSKQAKSEVAIALVQTVADDIDDDVRVRAVQALGDFAVDIPNNILESIVIDVLAKTITDPHEELRYQSAKTLADIALDSPETVVAVAPSVAKNLNDPNRGVRLYIAKIVAYCAKASSDSYLHFGQDDIVVDLLSDQELGLETKIILLDQVAQIRTAATIRSMDTSSSNFIL